MDRHGLVDELELFRAIQCSGARVLVIGRRALVAIGLPLSTHDYDLWVHIDDVEMLNAALEPLDHFPSVEPAEARRRGRYVLENGEHIDVMVARTQGSDPDSELRFDDAWDRRLHLPLADGVTMQTPDIDDLIRTKRWAGRAKDIADIQLLEALKRTRKA